jgi:hypothetical protein
MLGGQPLRQAFSTTFALAAVPRARKRSKGSTHYRSSGLNPLTVDSSAQLTGGWERLCEAIQRAGFGVLEDGFSQF